MNQGAAIVPDAGQWSEGTRIMLGAMREASREMCDGCYRDSIAELEDEETEGEGEADSLTLDGDSESFAMIRGFSARLTFGEFDGEGEEW